jgi:Glucuronate isomerase
MAKAFMDERFMLANETAAALYHKHARSMPIIDYHCHLNPREIYKNRKFANLTELWLEGDHYKWRLMRANGADEEDVTGSGEDYAKFLAYMRAVQAAAGNPLYHWSHMELRMFFGVDELMHERNAPAIWDKVNAQLGESGYGARDFLLRSNVEVVCTTDDPADTLEFHRKLREDGDFPVKVLPSFRPDKGLEINRPGFADWVSRLGEVCGMEIRGYDRLLEALEARVAFFHEAGGRVSDHGMEYVPYAETTRAEADSIFKKALRGERVSEEEERKYKTCTLVHLGRMYAERGWVMQLHMNASRNNNTRMYQRIGPDSGFDSINDSLIAAPLSRLLDALDKDDALPKTILYTLNPAQNHVIGAMIGNFQGGGIAGKMQFGAAWWFNDTKEGMLAQLKTLAELGLLSRFVGMLTDSRSFVSYVRHDYFRRILCSLIGEWVENGEFPDDDELLESLIRGICYGNAKRYFEF